MAEMRYELEAGDYSQPARLSVTLVLKGGVPSIEEADQIQAALATLEKIARSRLPLPKESSDG